MIVYILVGYMDGLTDKFTIFRPPDYRYKIIWLSNSPRFFFISLFLAHRFHSINFRDQIS